MIALTYRQSMLQGILLGHCDSFLGLIEVQTQAISQPDPVHLSVIESSTVYSEAIA